jgi:endonuclease/exonuclease/phosphatase family metal-dependent hydrolase
MTSAVLLRALARSSLALALSALAGCVGLAPDAGAPAPLVLASFNMEHLAARDGEGCRPRAKADYAALRDYVGRVGADVFALQEVESAEAAQRVFTPDAWVVVVETRTGSGRSAECRGLAGRNLTDQRTGFAVRRGLDFERHTDVTALQLGDADLRSGVDLVLRPDGGPELRLLSVHLKSGCSSGQAQPACPVFFEQAPQLEAWIDARAREPRPFVVLGDFNRRLALPDDPVWTDWDDGDPAEADLTLAAGGQRARCNPRYPDFIDHIVLDRRASQGLERFEETVFEGPALSDHCAISVRLRLD